MISILNKHTSGVNTLDDVYIGRPSALGNPFIIGRDGTREEVVDKYERWLRIHKNSATPKGDDVRFMLRRIYARAQRGNVNLICYCAPRLCHGDVIKRILEQEGTP